MTYPLHIVGGYVSAAFALWYYQKRTGGKMHLDVLLLVAVIGSVVVGVLFEFVQHGYAFWYMSDEIGRSLTLKDMLGDIVSDFGGGVLSFWYYVLRNGKWTF